MAHSDLAVLKCNDVCLSPPISAAEWPRTRAFTQHSAELVFTQYPAELEYWLSHNIPSSRDGYSGNKDYWLVKFCDSLSLGVEYPIQNSKADLFPNPCLNSIMVRANNKVKSFTIYDQFGKVCIRNTLLAIPQLEFNIDLSLIKNGVFCIRFETENISFSKTFVKLE